LSLSTKNGASIILSKKFSNHIFKVISTNEYWCSIHLKFKPKVDLLVTAIYLPHDPKERSIALKSLKIYLETADSNMHQVLARDFNTYPLNTHSVNAPQPGASDKYII
jgi:hypothetical protein